MLKKKKEMDTYKSAGGVIEEEDSALCFIVLNFKIS